MLPETAVNDMMMRRCQGPCYVLAPRGKIGQEHNFLSGSIDKISTLITCTGADQEEVQKMRAHGLEVIELGVNE